MRDVYHTKQWLAVRKAVLIRDGWRCQLCGDLIDQHAMPRSPRSATVDHIVPVLDGGSWYAMENLRAAHLVCNSVRANKGRGQAVVRYPKPRAW